MRYNKEDPLHTENRAELEKLLRACSNFELNTMIKAYYKGRRRAAMPSTKEKKVGLIMAVWKQDMESVYKLYTDMKKGIGGGSTEVVETTIVQEVKVDEDEIVEKVIKKKFLGKGTDIDVEELVRKEVAAIASEQLKKHRPIEIKTKGKKAKKIKGTMPEEFEKILELTMMRKNIMLVGPSGCGKTFIAEKVAEAANLPFSTVSCSAGMSESMLTGWLLPVEKGGQFTYIPAEFVKAYEKGGLFLLDEIDAADANLLVYINQAISNDHFFIPQRHKKTKILKHKDFVLIAAANTFGNGANMMFVGRNQLDAATLDRFRIGMITMDYSPLVEEATVDPEVLAWGRRVRESMAKRSYRRTMSTRFLQDATDMKEHSGWDRQRWEKTYFADWSSEEVSRVREDLMSLQGEDMAKGYTWS